MTDSFSDKAMTALLQILDLRRSEQMDAAVAAAAAATYESQRARMNREGSVEETDNEKCGVRIITEKLNRSVASHPPETTSILLDGRTAGLDRKSETSVPDWVNASAKVDQPLKELSVIEEVHKRDSDVADVSGRSSIGRSPQTSINSSRAFHATHQKYGERVSGDAIDIFCYRLKGALMNHHDSSFPTVEGLFPLNKVLALGRMVEAREELEKAKQKNDMNAVKALESELAASKDVQKEVKKAITGKNKVAQILFDASRLQYLVVFQIPQSEYVAVYDSNLDTEDPTACLHGIREQIIALFGHQYEVGIPIAICQDYEQDRGDWSCHVFGRSLAHRFHHLDKIYSFVMKSLESQTISLDQFYTAYLQLTSKFAAYKEIGFYLTELALSSPKNDSHKMEVIQESTESPDEVGVTETVEDTCSTR